MFPPEHSWLTFVLWLHELYGTVSIVEHIIWGDLDPYPEPQTLRVSVKNKLSLPPFEIRLVLSTDIACQWLEV